MKTMKALAVYRLLDLEQGHEDLSEYLLVNCAGYYEAEESFGATHRLYGRKDWYLAFNRAGRMKYMHKKLMYDIRENMVFIYAPNDEQYYGQADDNPIENYWVHFTGYGAASIMEKLGLTSGVYHVDKDLTDYFEKMIDELANKFYGFEAASAAWLLVILTEVARYAHSKVGPVSTADRRYSEIAKTVQYIKDNYHRKITIKELAELSHFSVSYYCSIFRDILKKSPQQYLLEYRLYRASDLVIRTRLSIREIAAMCGYNDQLYFSKKYKQFLDAHLPSIGKCIVTPIKRHPMTQV
ncbi:MAG: helix-turn-helix transcriptional regulator [Clostridiaceae bacterium]|nr:helix-turn-helix transcriptional regulator [Clostridiaceae bacterium]